MPAHFTSVHDVSDVERLLKKAFEIKSAPFSNKKVGENKTIGLVFFNPSLRTRVSSQKAASNLGADSWVLNSNQDSWKLETQLGAVMDGDKAEHIKEAIQVLSSYADVIGVRAFAELKNKEEDYADTILQQCMDYSSKPVVSLESAIRHPLQSLADLMTIEEHRRSKQLKVVLAWAPHVKPLPQAVPNSFVEWVSKIKDINLIINHPEGYELDPQFVKNAKVEYDRNKAFERADFIYVKNWSSVSSYGKILPVSPEWMINEQSMRLTNNARFMHCLPLRRNVVASDSVVDSPNSLVIAQAENRIYAAQTIFSMLLKGEVL